MSVKEEETQIIPDIIIDNLNRHSYKKGRFFGKGGFAKCYEITDMVTSEVFAGKIVSKKIMTKNNQKDKMTQEISIHRSLDHKHVVGFHGFFEDNHNVYIVLELCRRRSMMELHKRRKALTEPEVRYFMHHILLGVMYLHKRRIIHRDLKLGNLFLNDDLEVKIGDFGLAAKLEHDGERKMTLCGTPNYIAPEILTKQGHSYEVDVWSIGCILYTLLVGKPPFETSSLKETYSRIKRCEYRLPPAARVSRPAQRLINLMLQADPQQRPTVQQCLDHEFFTTGYMPGQLPVSCLTMAPRFDLVEKVALAKANTVKAEDKSGGVFRKPLVEMNGETASPKRPPRHSVALSSGRLPTDSAAASCRANLVKLRNQLAAVVKTLPKCSGGKVFGVEMTDPAYQPIVWITKWVDYSDKYGFGYQLSDDGVGVMFNDSTKLVMLADGKNVHYISREAQESYYTINEYPPPLDKKMKLLNYFHRYMNEHLMCAGADQLARECDAMSRMPYLYQWFRTSSAVVMHLNNGTVQINFTNHCKIVLCPLMNAVTWIDADKSFRTFRFSTIETSGCSDKLADGLRYSLDKIQGMIPDPSRSIGSSTRLPSSVRR